jgi:hypothetical protein
VGKATGDDVSLSYSSDGEARGVSEVQMASVEEQAPATVDFAASTTSFTVIHPGNQLPPGGDVGGPISFPSSIPLSVSKLVALADEPPPPPPPPLPPLPMTPPVPPPEYDGDVAEAELEVDGRVEFDEIAVLQQQLGTSEVEKLVCEPVLTVAAAVESTPLPAGVICAAPVLNRPHAVTVTTSCSAISLAVDSGTSVMSPSSPTCEGPPSALGEPHEAIVDAQVAAVAADSSSSCLPPLAGKERKKKREKSLVATGLSLKKKNLPSLVEKWQKVQHDVTEEVSKQELQKALKKVGGVPHE